MAVTDIGNRLSQQFLLSVLRGQMDETQRQSSTGKKSTTIAGLGSNAASASISYRNKSNLLDVYTNNLNIAKTRFEITDKAMTSITDTARDMISQLRSQLQDTTPQATILRDNANTQLKVLTDKMNTQIDGHYVFSGINSTSATYNNMTALMTNVGAIVTAAITDPLTSTSTVNTSLAAVTSAQLGLSSAAISSSPVSFQADDRTTMTYPTTGGGEGYSDILRGMAIVANLPQPTTAQEQENYWDMINSAIALMEKGAVAVDTYQAQMGSQAKIVDNLLATHQETKVVLEEYIGGVEDVDMADAAMRFANLKTQLETSYSIISTLKDLSLINYL